MQTKIYRTDVNAVGFDGLEYCATLLKQGGTVALPTETVYGIAANAFDVCAVEKLYIAKNRPPVKPISLCVSSIEQAAEVAVLDDTARKLYNAFMPGPLTLILPKKACVPDIVTAGGDTVGIRVPAHPLVTALSKLCGVPLALTSANLSGMPSPISGEEVVASLNGRVDAIIDSGAVALGKESTVLSLVGTPKILRSGALDKETIGKYIDLE